MPDFPMPVTMTRPLQLRIRTTARSNSAPMRSTSASTAAASVCRTLRAIERSGMFDDLIKRHEPAEQVLDAIEPQGIGRIALGARRFLVHFHEDAVDSGRDACLRHRL